MFAVAAITTLASATAWAQPAAAPASPAPEVIEVRAGDTFSAIAARVPPLGRAWYQLYDARHSGLGNPNVIVPGMRFEIVAKPAGGQYLRLIGASALAAAPAKPATTAAAPITPPPPPPKPAETLVVGVLPNIGAAALMAQYENLRSYLERTNGQKVRIVLPANFKAFFDATVRGDYDLAVSAPHLARVAQVDARLVPLVMYEPRIQAQFIAPLDSKLVGAAELRGKAIAFANPQSLVAMYGRQWLAKQGLEAGKDYEVKSARTDVGVGRMLLTDEVAAAVMSNGEFRALAPDESSRLKVVDVFARIPNFVVLGHPRLGGAQLARLKGQLLGFLADKDEGAAFAKATGISGIVPADEADLRELDAFVDITRKAMSPTN